MSNVEYRCLEPIKQGVKGRSGHYEHEGEVVCGSKVFAAPGGTRLTCPQHTRTYTQVEEFNGPLFEYIDDQGKVHHRVTGVRGDAVLGDGSVRQDMTTVSGQATVPVNPSTTYIADQVVTDSSGEVESYQPVAVMDVVDPTPIPDDATIGDLQTIYRKESGMEPDGRWKEKGLRDAIAENRDKARSMSPDPNAVHGDVDPNAAGKGEDDS